jgi:hypothetical protein
MPADANCRTIIASFFSFYFLVKPNWVPQQNKCQGDKRDYQLLLSRRKGHGSQVGRDQGHRRTGHLQVGPDQTHELSTSDRENTEIAGPLHGHDSDDLDAQICLPVWESVSLSSSFIFHARAYMDRGRWDLRNPAKFSAIFVP